MKHPLHSGAPGALPASSAAPRERGFRLRHLRIGGAAALVASLVLGVSAALLSSLPLGIAAGLAGGAGVGMLALLPLFSRMRREADAAEAEARAARAAIARLKAESAAKSRFLAEMSHELRTPLNAVIGFSEMMAHEVFGPHAVATYGDYARDIHASGRHLLALADDILDLARIETGHRALLETAVPLSDLAQDCAHMMRLAAAARSITLTCNAAPAAPRLWADERALRQMALNLLANAVKFTPKGGEVRLTVGADSQGAPFLAVEDTGPGLGEAELPLDLSARHRESTLDPTTGRGAGLGLTIVRGLAELHGAHLMLATRMGGGTRASVVFPATRLLAPAEQRVAAPDEASARA
ncbi:HAMP domain-containing sensor histidine kinase [Aquabacter sp. CN5-332]|uniref:sensor histidine kinase n=1 Tax=Aquabacter sp. CN5-332 TaxID=3156608 RepID=UPI0032B32032